jgi:hypothetical protein
MVKRARDENRGIVGHGAGFSEYQELRRADWM